MEHFIVFTECSDNTGRVIGGGYMHVTATNRQAAEDEAIRLERESWGSPRLNVRALAVMED